MERRAKVVLNPVRWNRGAWRVLPAMVEAFENAGILADISFTKITQAMTDSVRRAVMEEYDLVVAGGGDGTVSEIAASLVGTRIPLGILPIGTYNNIAHSLGLPFDPVEAALCIAGGKTRDIDVGVANGIYFFEAVGVGLDAAVFPIGEEIKGGHYERVLAGTVRFLRQRRADMTIRVDGQDVRFQLPMVVIANGPYYGAGFTVAPQARLDDGQLDVVCFDCTKGEISRHFALSARNRQHDEPCVYMLRGREIEILSSLPLPAHADGKPLGPAPVTCRVLPAALRVIVP